MSSPLPRPLPFATGSAGKLALFASLIPEGWTVVPYSPGDAEQKAARDYASAALAKAEAVCLEQRVPYAMAHDSGFEFDCLGGEPGPHTHAWLDGERGGSVRDLVPRSRVRVVHCIAVVGPGLREAFVEADVRWVREGPLPKLTGDLPLTELVDGPRAALQLALRAALEKLDASLEGPGR